MKVQLADILKTASGGYGTSPFITLAGGRVKAFPRGRKVVNSSSEQQRVQAFLRTAAAAWRNLTQLQREAWEAYADEHFTRNDEGEEVTPTGFSTYIGVNSTRQTLQLPLTTNAPTLAPPAPLVGIEQMGAQNPDSLGIIVQHGYATLTGLSVLVRMTPPTTYVGDKPDVSGLRFVRGLTANSAQPLPASGGELTFTPTRFFVNDGERYGVEARIVRLADGTVSSPIMGDFLKSI